MTANDLKVGDKIQTSTEEITVTSINAADVYFTSGETECRSAAIAQKLRELNNAKKG